MNDREFRNSAFIVAGVVLVGILLWWLHDRSIAGQQELGQPPAYADTSPVGFALQGPGGATPGPLNFPSAIFNIVAPGPQSIAQLAAGNCSCGCDGSNGNTTVNFQLPGFQDLINQLAATQAATAQANLDSIYASMGYSQAVFVSDNTRTLFNGGNPFAG